MTARSFVPQPRDAAVLKDAVLTARPHALARPAQRDTMRMFPEGAAAAQRAPASIDLRTGASVPTGQPPVAGRQPRDEGFAQGRAEGLEQGALEARERIDAAVRDAVEQALREHRAQMERERAALEHELRGAYRQRLELVDSMLAQLPSQIEARLSAVEDDMIALCHAVVCRMLGDAAPQPQAIGAQVTRALRDLRHTGMVSAYLHPDDLDTLRRAAGESPSEGLRAEEIQWLASSEVQMGGCILRSPAGGLDARLETQLEALKTLLTQTRAARFAEGLR